MSKRSINNTQSDDRLKYQEIKDNRSLSPDDKKTAFIDYIKKKYTFEDIDHILYMILSSESDYDFKNFIREIQMQRMMNYGGRKKTKSSSNRTAKSKSKAKTYKKKGNKRKKKTKDKGRV
jgi:hypothetical protein